MQYHGNNRNVSVAIIAVHFFEYHPNLKLGYSKMHFSLYVNMAAFCSNSHTYTDIKVELDGKVARNFEIVSYHYSFLENFAQLNDSKWGCLEVYVSQDVA